MVNLSNYTSNEALELTSLQRLSLAYLGLPLGMPLGWHRQAKDFKFTEVVHCLDFSPSLVGQQKRRDSNYAELKTKDAKIWPSSGLQAQSVDRAKSLTRSRDLRRSTCGMTGALELSIEP